MSKVFIVIQQQPTASVAKDNIVSIDRDAVIPEFSSLRAVWVLEPKSSEFGSRLLLVQATPPTGDLC